jgi:hypothetical protein
MTPCIHDGSVHTHAQPMHICMYAAVGFFATFYINPKNKYPKTHRNGEFIS